MKERDRHRLLTAASTAPEPLCSRFPRQPCANHLPPACIGLPSLLTLSLHEHRQLSMAGRIQIADTGCYYALHIYPVNFTASRLRYSEEFTV